MGPITGARTFEAIGSLHESETSIAGKRTRKPQAAPGGVLLALLHRCLEYCGAEQNCAVQYNTGQFDTVQYSAVQCNSCRGLGGDAEQNSATLVKNKDWRTKGPEGDPHTGRTGARPVVSFEPSLRFCCSRNLATILDVILSVDRS